MNELYKCFCEYECLLLAKCAEFRKVLTVEALQAEYMHQESVVKRTSLQVPVLSNDQMLCLEPVPGKLHFPEIKGCWFEFPDQLKFGWKVATVCISYQIVQM